MEWTIAADDLKTPLKPGALTDVLPLLERLTAAFGMRRLARLLGVGTGTITNWKQRRHAISPVFASRIIAFHEVMTIALNVYPPRVAMDWLVGANAFLKGARPVDVLTMRGAGPLIEALEAAEAGAYP